VFCEEEEHDGGNVESGKYFFEENVAFIALNISPWNGLFRSRRRYIPHSSPILQNTYLIYIWISFLRQIDDATIGFRLCRDKFKFEVEFHPGSFS